MLIEFEEYRTSLNDLKARIKNLHAALGIDGLAGQIAELEQEAAAPGFWDEMEQAQKVLQKTKHLKDKQAYFARLEQDFDDLETLIDLALEEQDESLLEEVKASYNSIDTRVEEKTLETLLSGPYDKNNAILTFHAGAGGTEAMDWAAMLYRMYTRWAERHEYTIKLLDWLDGEEAGMKSATLLVEGENAFGYLKSEMGVHRLVRVSPFDASGRRQTSFASLEVMPEINEDIKIDIRPEDLRVDTYRSSGAGGQHVNKTESAIRITHLPTGIVVACQNERSQHQNREVAMRMLKSKLVEIKEREHLDRIEDIKGEQMAIGWGSQIRSYVFMPYTLAKDHRTNFEVGNINAVMDGDLDGFINAYLQLQSRGGEK